ncbi:MFS transporter [Pseudomonas sp. WS 5532]|nr:MFS transporter [Pseudomonas sp. PA-6-3C]MCF5148524.1 MFS transporter [Pseudomonas sp. PA-6-3F]MCF5157297.1 MFS transporter [Pseudomonas sp. PA-6-2E]MCF5173649.1 MFS transporter [Pseudomonas sp. PA-6-1D]MCF5191780.1 MFS transporter [Pseudomonas sp. PA-6-1H]NMX73932.1 MFS transporter [Pseudomonas sp. WS 5532]
MMKTSSKLICVQALSSLSLWLDIFLIFTIPVYLWHASPSSIALLAFCLGAPMLFLGPIVGTLIDRHDARKTLAFGALVRTLSTLALAVSPDLKIFLLFVILKGVSNLFYFPSITIMVRQLIVADERKSFFSYISVFDQSTKILAPLLAGILTIILSPKDLFFLSAAAVLLTFPLLRSICRVFQPKIIDASTNPLPLYRDIARGIAIFNTLPFQLRIGFLYSLLTSLALGIYDPHLASFLAYEGLPSVNFSVIVSATAAGAIGAALLVKFKFSHIDELLLRTHALVVFSAALILTATLVFFQVPGRAYIYPLAWFLNGFGYETLIISSNIILQQLCPPDTIGRVSMSFRSVQILCVIIGPSLGTLIIIAGGRPAPFIVSAGIAFLTASVSIAVYLYVCRKQAHTPVN